ncbi:MAG: M67 family metallopeptidase [Planctomycetes bacterium]|nr:M67 family metallopeptidase [Planctomycetota bacterium]
MGTARTGQERSFRLTRAARDAMAAHVEVEHPDEACGFVFSKGSELEVWPMENIQDRRHREDPIADWRTARLAYEFDPKAFQRVLLEKERAGQTLRAIYHSHPDHDAYFSETDSAAAAPLGEPSLPGVVYLVFSVRGGKAVDTKAFDWSQAAGKYVEMPIELIT